MIDETYFIVCVFSLAIGTFAIRSSFISFSGKMKNSENLREFFSYIPAAVLPGFIFPAVFYHHGKVEWLMNRERLIVLILSSVLFYFVRSTLLIIGVGLALLYVVTQYL